MNRLLNYGAILIAVFVGVAVMHLKQQVQERREEIRFIAEDIRRDREDIRVLEAEWALLSSPSVLQERSYKFLALMPLMPSQIVQDPNAVPMRRRGEKAEMDEGILLPVSKPRYRPVKYKKRNDNAGSGARVIRASSKTSRSKNGAGE